jgi:undecaprenyl-diphosphatase
MQSLEAQAVLLGVLQGLTEFLPVSSSGHLALCQQLIPGFEQPGILLDVMLHAGTSAAVVVYFRRELHEILLLGVMPFGRQEGAGRERGAKKLLAGIIIASIPTAVIGVLLEARVEWLFGQMTGVGAALLVTGAVLIAGERIGRMVEERPGNPGLKASFIIGVAQGISVIPGISRSGATISVARGLGITGTEAARFSFLISLPAITGAALFSVIKQHEAIMKFSFSDMAAYTAGPLAAAVVGYAAIGVVMRMMKSGTLIWFSVYCFALGAISIAASFWI